jgi:hypothetical protein
VVGICIKHLAQANRIMKKSYVPPIIHDQYPPTTEFATSFKAPIKI